MRASRRGASFGYFIALQRRSEMLHCGAGPGSEATVDLISRLIKREEFQVIYCGVE